MAETRLRMASNPRNVGSNASVMDQSEFWVASAAAAPVIGLAHVVGLAKIVTRLKRWIRGQAGGSRTHGERVQDAVILVMTVVAVAFDAWVLLAALHYLATGKPLQSLGFEQSLGFAEWVLVVTMGAIVVVPVGDVVATVFTQALREEDQQQCDRPHAPKPLEKKAAASDAMD
jgi:hypothetical protein